MGTRDKFLSYPMTCHMTPSKSTCSYLDVSSKRSYTWYVMVILTLRCVLTFVKQLYSNVEFLRPLIDYMKTEDPSSRPDAHRALKRWHRIRRKPSFLLTPNWRLRGRKEDPEFAVADDIIMFFRFCYMLPQTPFRVLYRSIRRSVRKIL